jgi:hypothetical protein
MTRVLSYLLIVLSLIILGAHFLRDGQTVAVAGSLLLVPLLMVRRPWVARLTQLVLILGAIEWLRTIYVLVQLRTAHDEPFARLVVILGLVAAVTLCAALLFQFSPLRRIYRLDK